MVIKMKNLPIKAVEINQMKGMETPTWVIKIISDEGTLLASFYSNIKPEVVV